MHLQDCRDFRKTLKYLLHLTTIYNFLGISSAIMPCGCQRRIVRTTYKNCTATPKHEVEAETFFTCSEKKHTGYTDVYLASSMVKAPGHVCPKC